MKVKTILITFAIIISVALWFTQGQVKGLKSDLLRSKAGVAELRMVNDSTLQIYALIIEDEKALRLLIEEELHLTERDLEGSLRAYSSLQIAFEELRGHLDATEVDSADTSQGLLLLRFDSQVTNLPGYSIGWKPTITAPKRLYTYKDSITVQADVWATLDPFQIKVVLTEAEDGTWQTTFQVDSPLLNKFNDVRTYVNPHQPTVWDRVYLHSGLSLIGGNELYLKLGAGYDNWSISALMGESKKGLSVDGYISLKDLRLWR